MARSRVADRKQLASLKAGDENLMTLPEIARQAPQACRNH
jgi:hypothetical protein